MIEQMAELLQHVTKCRLGSRDSRDLFVAEGVDFGHWIAASRQLAQTRTQPRFDDSPCEFWRRRFEANCLDCAVLRDVNRVIETVLNVTVERRHEPVPQSAFR